MSKPRRTPEDVCIEYAIAVMAIRAQTCILASFPCGEGYTRAIDISVDETDGYFEPPDESCMDKHFRIETYQAGDDRPTERPELAAEDMCENCQKRLQAINDRKDARKRLGAIKRSIEVVGKRLIDGPVKDLPGEM